jgi:hypothetical protein
VNRWGKLRKAVVHAFALGPRHVQFSTEELALLDKVAGLIVRRGMTAPALLFLESLGPLSFLGSQVLHGLKPFLDVVCDPTELERLAAILERRASVDTLVSLIQEQANFPT